MGLEQINLDFHNKQEEALDMESENKIDSKLLDVIIEEEKKRFDHLSNAYIHVVVLEYLSQVKDKKEKPTKFDLFKAVVLRLDDLKIEYNRKMVGKEWERLEREEKYGVIEEDKEIKISTKTKSKGHVGLEKRLGDDL